MNINYKVTDADSTSGDITIEFTTPDYPELPPIIQKIQVPMVNDVPVSTQELHDSIMAAAPVDFFYRMTRIKQNATTKISIESLVGMTGTGEKFPDLTRDWDAPLGI